MVIGLFIITAIPATTGVCQAVSAQNSHEQREKDERRMKKFNIDVECKCDNACCDELEGGRLYLKHNSAWIQTSRINTKRDTGYTAEAFYIEFPDRERVSAPMGLVSQVQDDPPLLNWLYVDKNTREVKYGNKTASKDHHVGSWDWTDDEQYITFEQREGEQTEDFLAVYNPSKASWQLFCDLDQDKLRGYIPSNWFRLPVRLKRSIIHKL